MRRWPTCFSCSSSVRVGPSVSAAASVAPRSAPRRRLRLRQCEVDAVASTSGTRRGRHRGVRACRADTASSRTCRTASPARLRLRGRRGRRGRLLRIERAQIEVERRAARISGTGSSTGCRERPRSPRAAPADRRPAAPTGRRQTGVAEVEREVQLVGARQVGRQHDGLAATGRSRPLPARADAASAALGRRLRPRGQDRRPAAPPWRRPRPAPSPP